MGRALLLVGVVRVYSALARRVGRQKLIATFYLFFVIGAAAYHAVGFFTSCEQIVYFRPAMLQLTPGLHCADNFGVERPFDQAALQRVLDTAPRRGERLRMQASAWLPGRLIGPFRYEGTRGDDPNDIVAHEGRERFGYFNAVDFSAEGWKNEYPNPAFGGMTERDGAWAARILARFTPSMVRALAEMGEFCGHQLAGIERPEP